MNPYFIGGAVVGFALWSGAVFSAGNQVGASGVAKRDLQWKSQIEAANDKAEAAEKKYADHVSGEDKRIRSALASKEQEIKDRDDALEKARATIPLSADCSRCVIDARRLRQGAGSADNNPQTRVPASGSK